MAYSSQNAINRRNWNLIIVQGEDNADPLHVFFAFDPVASAGPGARGEPLAVRNEFVTYLSSYGTATFEGIANGLIPNVPVNLVGLSGETIRITGVSQFGGSNGIRVRDVSIAGRYNTTPAGVKYCQVDADNFSELTFTPSVGTFNSFGIYITDAGDFLPAVYTIQINTNNGVLLPEFDLSEFFPTSSGCLLFWGFTLPTGYLVSSVKILISSPEDQIGWDDVIFGNSA